MGYIGDKVIARLDLQPMPDDVPVPEIVPELAGTEPEWVLADR